MKNLNLASIIILLLTGCSIKVSAQDNLTPKPIFYENYGNTLNLGVGVGYYGYVGHSVAAFHADYEINVARSFTLAPFINFYSFQDYAYSGDPRNPYLYYYNETVIPIGVKGFYYFDRLLDLNRKWDLYAAASLGFVIRTTTWQDGYDGPTAVNDGSGALFLDIHAGARYHINRRTGLFLDLSTGVSTIGLSFHI